MQVSADDLGLILSQLRWDVFGTLTFSGTVPRPAIAWGLAWQHMRHASVVHSQPYRRLLIAFRAERGEIGGRFHFHYLLGGLETTNIHASCHRLEHDWKARTSGARVEIRPYDRARSGADYIAKCLGAKNAYELTKFSSADSVTLSRSVALVVGRINRHVERRDRTHK